MLVLAFNSMSPVVIPSPGARGRPFQPIAEALLIPGLLEAAIGCARDGRRLILLSEFRGPFGVPDLTIVETDDETLQARLALGIPPLLNQVDAAIVGSLEWNRPRRLSLVAELLGWPEQDIRRRAELLRRSGVIVRTRSGSFLRPEALKPLGQVAVYEAKVADWRRGLFQASTYATWADSASLTVGRLPRDATRAVDLAAHLRIGLFANGKWHRRATRQSLSRSVRVWTSEFVVAGMFDHHPSPMM
jgi:hypothetical protein